MKMKKIFAIASAALLLAGCSSDDPIVLPDPEPEVQESPVLDSPSEYHEKMRTVPYPRSTNELYINPAPLIVPQKMKTNTYLQFALSTSADFAEGATVVSEPVAWNMWNPHRQLEQGTWYWRFRNISSSGEVKDWSDTYSFEIKGDEPVFVTPTWETFLSMAPQFTPRLWCFLDAKLSIARQKAQDHPEYKSLIQRAGTAVATDYSKELNNLYKSHDKLYQNVEYLYQAYLITRDEQ